MPAGTKMRDIADRPEADRKLQVGVDENTLQLSAGDPGDQHELKGFEVELAHELADAILGDPNVVQLVPVVTEQKVPFVEDGTVDLTISVVSMTCDRWQHVDFSSEYLTTHQTVMVRNDAPDRRARRPRRPQGVRDQRRDDLRQDRGLLRASTGSCVHRGRWSGSRGTDCLLALQDGAVDAIASHATILYGLHEQDPDNTRILLDNRDLGEQHYGIAVPKSDDHAFASFVNGVLARLRADGQPPGAVRPLDRRAMPPGTATLPDEPQDFRS